MAIASAKQSTGLDLKLARVATGVSQTRVAAELGVSRQQITYIEAVYRPSPRWIDRYLDALARITSP